MRLTIRAKLVTGFIMCICSLLAANVMGLFQMNTMAQTVQNINNTNLPSIVLLNEMGTSLKNIENGLFQMMSSTRHSEIEQLTSKLDEETKRMEVARGKYDAMKKGISEARNFFQFTNDWQTLAQQIPQTIKVIGTTDHTNMDEKGLQFIKYLSKKANDSINQLVQTNQQSADEEAAIAVSLIRSSKSIMISLSSLGIVLASIAATWISIQIGGSIKKISIYVRKVSEGDLTAEPPTTKSRDEIGVLAKHVEDLSVSIREKICQIVLGAQQVAATSEQLSASADQTAKATEVITESVNEIATGSEKQVLNDYSNF